MSSTRTAYIRGLWAGAPFLVMAAPFGMLFGVVASEAGLDLFQTMAMSIIVVAGASQFSAVQVLSDGAPFYIAVLTGLAVNMRMAMYSASLAPHLGKAVRSQRVIAAYFMIDQTYGVSILELDKKPDMPVSEKLAYFFGTATLIFPLWYVATLVGILVGNTIPPEYALDFAVPIMFIALVAPNLRSIPHLAAAVVSVAVSLLLVWMPYNMWLMVAAVAAMITGAEVERQLEARK
ncbi:MAG: AzlC family ABC transporter permease [Rhodobacteraceae bacterium]|nr:AzlC family ABC transporter permease [Paracoccaceae bacterium]